MDTIKKIGMWIFIALSCMMMITIICVILFIFRYCMTLGIPLF